MLHKSFANDEFANILIANLSSNSVIVITFYQQPGQFSQVGTWSRSGKEIHVALDITDGLPTETLRLKNSSPLIVKTRLVSCYASLRLLHYLMPGQVMWGCNLMSWIMYNRTVLFCDNFRQQNNLFAHIAIGL